MADTFSNYMFTSSATNFICPLWVGGHYTWRCDLPGACATDSSTTKQYCCNAGDVCWAPASTCASDGSTFTCSGIGYAYCCLKNKEICTQLAGQINICYNLAHDTLTNISTSVLNETYSSLSSAQPSASSYTFDPLALIAQTQTISTKAISTQASSTQTVTPTSSIRPANDNHSPSPLAGGIIAGIVIGVVAAIAIVCIVAFLIVRHRKRKQSELVQAADPKYVQPIQEVHGEPGYRPQEMQADTTHAKELPGPWQHYSPEELPT